jgi:D-alanyl-lipoteichoic acid acyltransferase DltB (MBOAT superfamily)
MIFKYFDFFSNELGKFLFSFGIKVTPIFLNLFLPIGISFYTLVMISYNVEVYERKIKPIRDFIAFALSVAFFPKLTAGPITKTSDFFPQITQKRSVDWDIISGAIQLILLGFFKKVVIADVIGGEIDVFYLDPRSFEPTTSLIITWLFVIQIYADFSGYTDIARGVSKLYGIEIPVNFNQPLLATNFSKFWRRWHISLSVWLKDHIYIPLGGNQKSIIRMFGVLLLLFVVSGFWHGIGELYILWGFLTGILFILHKLFVYVRSRITENRQIYFKENQFFIKFYTFLSWFVTIQLISLSWVFFRSVKLSNALYIVESAYIQSFLSFSPPKEIYLILLIFSILFIGLIDIFQFKQQDHEIFTNLHYSIRGILFTFMIIMILLFQFEYSPPFIYQGF